MYRCLFRDAIRAMKFRAPLLLFFLLIMPAARGSLLSASSLEWNVVPGFYDYLNDHQTGQSAGDIVGTVDSASDPGFFTGFIQNETGSHLAFRVRLDNNGGNKSNPAFDRFLWVGLDASGNGAIDVFLGVNRQGSNNALQISAPGTGLNMSPNTTTIANTPYFTTGLVVDNYNYRAVDFLFDGGTTNDLFDGNNDYYVSFATPMQQIAGYLATKSISYNETTPVRYVVATATQGNSLNQDIGGIQGNLNSALTWDELGGISPLMTASGGVIPEPSTTVMGTFGVLFLLSLSRRAIKRRR